MSKWSSRDPFALALVGMSFRSAPFELLERAALEGDRLNRFYERIMEQKVATDCFVLSTCNRTEVYATGEREPEDLRRHLLEVLCECVSETPDPTHVYSHSGFEAIEHLYRVSCGLDSMMLGENQIVGQLRNAYERGAATLTPSPALDGVMQGCFRVASRARAETDIAKGAVSVASAAVHLASRVFGDMSRRDVVVVGAGETGRLTAQYFAKYQPRSLTILNRTVARAEAVAREVGGKHGALDELSLLLGKTDILASAVSSDGPVVTRAMVEHALSKHPSGSLAFLDLGLPRNVDPAVNELGNVFVHDLTSLERMVDTNIAKRRGEIPRVEAIIRGEIERLEAHRRTGDAGPLIQGLREAVEAMRVVEVERATKALSDAERTAVERATRAVVNKLLHGPTQSIKEAARSGDSAEERLRVIREVFRTHREDD